MNALHPTEDQVASFLAHPKSTEPVFMLNLLKFKARADYDPPENVSGRTAYGRYANAFGDMLREAGVEGVETVFGGSVNSVLIGDAIAADWDAVALVRYPDAKTMFDLVSSDSYRSIHFHRKAGLEGQLLIACDGSGVF